jgi:hypothetical protein
VSGEGKHESSWFPYRTRGLGYCRVSLASVCLRVSLVGPSVKTYRPRSSVYSQLRPHMVALPDGLDGMVCLPSFMGRVGEADTIHAVAGCRRWRSPQESITGTGWERQRNAWKSRCIITTFTQLCVLSTHPTNPARISPRTRTLCITPLDASNTLTTFTSLSALLQRKLNSIAAATSDYNTIYRNA